MKTVFCRQTDVCFIALSFINLINFPAERAAFSQTSLASGWLAENGGAVGAEDDSGGVRKHGSNLEASRALDIHEEGIGRLHQTLELVLGLLKVFRRMQ